VPQGYETGAAAICGECLMAENHCRCGAGQWDGRRTSRINRAEPLDDGSLEVQKVCEYDGY